MGRRKGEVPIQIRKCMKCQKQFKSAGMRICPECTQINEKEFMPVYVNTRRQGIEVPHQD